MQNIHFIGIGGIGISALARFLKKKALRLAGVILKKAKLPKN